MIPTEIIEEIRNKADIVKVISEYVKLKKRGKNHIGLCPFHSEKEPSFTVSPEKQLFHCFGCNEGGNVFAFIMKMENVSFLGAIEELAEKLGIPLPAISPNSPQKSDKERFYQTMLIAAKFFTASLEGENGAAARNYLGERKTSQHTKQQFSLGFAPAGWDNLFKHLISRGVPPDVIETVGLTLKKDEKGSFYDRFRNRLIFPIHDQRGRIVAFGGRTLGNEEPKYLNSPDTPIYQKGATLFGLNHSKESIRKTKTAVLVEGYFDLITPVQSGISNIIATLGTAFTTSQAKLLSRFCETVILAFDADSAGFTAAEKSIELLRNENLEVKVCQLHGGKDPDEIVRKEGIEAFGQALRDAIPYLEFKIKRVASRCNLKEIEGRSKAVREVASILSRENNPFLQKEYARFSSHLLLTDADSILSEIQRMGHYRSSAPLSLKRVTAKPSSKIEEAEKHLLALAIQNNSALARIKQELKAEDFNLPEAKVLVDMLFASNLEENPNPTHFLLDNLPGEEAKSFVSRLLLCEHAGGRQEEIVSDCINVLKHEHSKVRIEALKLELQEAEKLGKTEKVTELLSVLKSEIS